MILFYSDYCPHCRMLLDTIKRHDSQGMVKLACIESLRAKGQSIPPQIHSVPALVLMPNRQIIYGKNVFDYLLLPGSGKLLVSVSSSTSHGGGVRDDAKVVNEHAHGEPMAYSMLSNGLSDAFAMIEENVHPMDGLNDRSYNWASIEQLPDQVSVFANAPLQEETRSKKGLPDLDTLRAKRDMELKQSDINTTQLIPPTFTR